MEFSDEAQKEVKKNRYDTLKAYGVTVSKTTWENIEKFKLRLKHLSSEKIILDYLRSGNIVVYKNCVSMDSPLVENTNIGIKLKPYRVQYVDTDEKRLFLTPPGKSTPQKCIDNLEKIHTFSIVRDHIIATKLGDPSITLPNEL